MLVLGFVPLLVLVLALALAPVLVLGYWAGEVKETLDLTVGGSAPAALVRTCGEPVLPACHALAGAGQFALPRNNAAGMQLTVLPRAGQSVK